jgi:hypothetical protein
MDHTSFNWRRVRGGGEGGRVGEICLKLVVSNGLDPRDEDGCWGPVMENRPPSFDDGRFLKLSLDFGFNPDRPGQHRDYRS